jgi:DNA (cytosine-5)-methyltransferase 1
MKHGSLFSGIGGFDLAAEWMGWENVFHCEWNEFGRKVLNHYWPKSISYEDITSVDFRCHRGTIDILTGGFPCQPYSNAGKRLGKEDERHLWPEMLRAIREIRPTYVVGENVRGLVNWSGGLVFEEVCADLEAEGYEVQPFLLPACGKDAPHRRDRIWFVAHTERGSVEREHIERQEQGELRRRDSKDASDSIDKRLQRSENGGEARRKGEGEEQQSAGFIRPSWENFPTEPPICGGDDGLPERMDGISFPKWRNESIKAYGNAIVPQVAFEIFKAIQKQR